MSLDTSSLLDNYSHVPFLRHDVSSTSSADVLPERPPVEAERELMQSERALDDFQASHRVIIDGIRWGTVMAQTYMARWVHRPFDMPRR